MTIDAVGTWPPRPVSKPIIEIWPPTRIAVIDWASVAGPPTSIMVDAPSTGPVLHLNAPVVHGHGRAPEAD